MQGIGDRALGRFIVLRERAIGHGSDWYKQSSDSFRVHDEWSHVSLRIGVGLEIRHVVANPFLLGLAPPDLLTIRIPRLAVQIAGGTVVKYSPVHRPRPPPVRVNPETRRIFRSSALEDRKSVGPRSAVEPISRHGRTVIAQESEARQLLVSFDSGVGLGVGDIAYCFAVDFLCNLGKGGVVRIGIAPGCLQNRIRKFATFVLIFLTDLQEDARQYFLIESAVSGRRDRSPLPLQPARRVDEGPILLCETSARQAVHGGVDLLHVLGGSAGCAPELASLV